ncbi:hypothetical protein BD626DRAFT_479557 [Schizophyllum amplum]|uniref:Uncharacterized protein n=1 Tax=Schizophyllum amplum TaxID=97359 RepID=A0A550CSD2_9AGAR|nr:hypothetical protein BD626DRAFT_479557 [Auriculariopsis ampla]
MPFHARNAYYLKISDRNILPLYVYLDERHLDWMNDHILQHVLADLRPHIVPKLRAEAEATQSTAGAKKLTLDTHRGDSYQFAYFLRKTHPHSVLIKTRQFVAAPPAKPAPPPPAPTPAQGPSKRKARSKAPRALKRQKTKGKARADEDEELAVTSDEDVEDEHLPNSAAPRRSQRNRKAAVATYTEDVDDMETDDAPESSAPPPTQVEEHVQDEKPDQVEEPDQDVDMSEAPAAMPPASPPPDEQPSVFDLVEDEEEKPKPLLQLRYQGFSIFGHCLCVVVEPWPKIRSASGAPSRAGSVAPPRAISLLPFDRETSVAPPGTQRARTPLFLPDPDDRRSLTPGPRGLSPAPRSARDGSAALASSRDGSVAPTTSRDGRMLPPVPLFDDPPREPLFLGGEEDDEDDDMDDGGGMMALSQALHAAGDLPGTAAEDDEDMDGSIFFGDADEVREL